MTFTPPGGKVHVGLKRVNSHLEISVADTGKGIAPEFLPHVFERFSRAEASSTRQHRGLGLGLSIVKSLAEMHGGTVRVESPGEGKGSIFALTLPLLAIDQENDDDAREHPRKGDAVLFSCDISLAGLRVLVVDDERDAREVVSRILRQCDAAAFPASSVREALEVLKLEKVDVVISDIGMPTEDGYWLIRQIRSLPPDQGGTVPAAALTAFARSDRGFL